MAITDDDKPARTSQHVAGLHRTGILADRPSNRGAPALITAQDRPNSATVLEQLFELGVVLTASMQAGLPDAA